MTPRQFEWISPPATPKRRQRLPFSASAERQRDYARLPAPAAANRSAGIPARETASTRFQPHRGFAASSIHK
ncbi:MAG: hypothetical protein LBI02_06480 [Opitutaceae bacterium]|nr:hypothetical protein [Opitutaceae bacterium]